MHSVAAALLGALLVRCVTATTPSAGCGKAPQLITSSAATTPLSMTVNGTSRKYYVKLPHNYVQDHPYRLMLTLHARGGNAQQVTAGTNGYLPWYGMPDVVNEYV